jgi:S-methylmethionine-dependent homocysteine/selenocysteine methylase
MIYIGRMTAEEIRERIRSGPAILLDGAIGTELNRRGVDTRLPLWSTWALLEAPDTLATIHRDYVEAGADILTANTFRTHRRSLEKAGLGDRAAELTADAVAIARRAADEREGVLVAGSVAPLEDCYEPGLVPETSALRTEHREIVENLRRAGVDLLLVETMNTIREAVAATEAALESGLPTIAGMVCGRGPYLLSGEPVGEAARSLSALGPEMIVVNCTPTPAISGALREIMAATDLATGAYGNVGYADEEQGWVNTDSVDPVADAEDAAEWLQMGARLVGSCCGTGPSHTAALRRLLDERPHAD